MTVRLAEKFIRGAGYNGSYTIGKNLWSKEPKCMVTRGDDPQWSDFVNYVLQSLYTAESKNITQSTAHLFTKTRVFGKQFEYMFVNAIAAVGNYGELYKHTMGQILPRNESPGDFINVKGTSGLIYSRPFGSRFYDGPKPERGSTLASIVERGYLVCGIMARPGFGELDPTTKNWSGLDADYCRALSSCIFSNSFSRDDERVVFVNLSATNEEFVALSNRTIDVLSGGDLNIITDVAESITREGFTFTQPYFYSRPRETDTEEGEEDGPYLPRTIALATRQDDAHWSSFVYFVVTMTFFA